MVASPEYIESAVNAALRADEAVKAICSGRVHPLKIPQGTLLPAIVYQRVYSNPQSTLQGYSSESVTIMINSFALTYSEAKELALAVRGALAGEPLSAMFFSERDLLNDTGDVFCISAEYACMQHGGYCHG